MIQPSGLAYHRIFLRAGTILWDVAITYSDLIKITMGTIFKTLLQFFETETKISTGIIFWNLGTIFLALNKTTIYALCDMGKNVEEFCYISQIL